MHGIIRSLYQGKRDLIEYKWVRTQTASDSMENLFYERQAKISKSFVDWSKQTIPSCRNHISRNPFIRISKILLCVISFGSRRGIEMIKDRGVIKAVKGYPTAAIVRKNVARDAFRCESQVSDRILFFCGGRCIEMV